MEIATTRVSSRGQIVIPVGMRTEFKEGDNLVIFRNGDSLIIKKEKDLADWEDIKVFADEKLWAESWNSKEDEEAFAYLQ